MDRENYNELIESIDSVGADDIAHFASYGGYNKNSLQHTREIGELIRAYGDSYLKEKSDFLHNVSDQRKLLRNFMKYWEDVISTYPTVEIEDLVNGFLNSR